MLEAVNLTKVYDDGIKALDSINFSIEAGKIFAMLGANGAGKTTCINIFLNFIEPTDGEALVAGLASHRHPLEVKSRLAYVSENVMLYPNFTAMQNLRFFSKLGGHHSYNDSDYEQVLTRVGLQQGAFHKKLKNFSKGMRQKCGIAISILKDASAILLDEPTSGLDPKAGHEFVNLLKSLRDEGKAVLMSTHDIFRAKEIADTIGIMKSGKLVMMKEKEELEHENMEQLYMEYMAGRNSN